MIHRPTSPVLSRSSFQSFDYFAPPPPPSVSAISPPVSSASASPRPISMLSSTSFGSAFHLDFDKSDSSDGRISPDTDCLPILPSEQTAEMAKVLLVPSVTTPMSERQRQTIHIENAGEVNWARPLRDQEKGSEIDISSPVQIFGESQQRLRRLRRAATVATSHSPPSPPTSDDEPQPLTPPALSPSYSVFAQMQKRSSGGANIGLGVTGISWDNRSTSSAGTEAELRPSPGRAGHGIYEADKKLRSWCVAPEMGDSVALQSSASRHTTETTMSRQASSTREKKIKRKAVPSLPLDSPDSLDLFSPVPPPRQAVASQVPPVPALPPRLEMGSLAMHPNFSTLSLKPMRAIEVAPPLPSTPTSPDADILTRIMLPSQVHSRSKSGGFLSSWRASSIKAQSFEEPILSRKKSLKGLYGNARGAMSVVDLSPRKHASHPNLQSRSSQYTNVDLSSGGGCSPILEMATPVIPNRQSSLGGRLRQEESRWSDSSNSIRSDSSLDISLSGGSGASTDEAEEIQTPLSGTSKVDKVSFIEEMDRGLSLWKARESRPSPLVSPSPSSLSSGPIGLADKLKDKEEKKGGFLGRSSSMMKAKKGLSKLLHRSSAR